MNFETKSKKIPVFRMEQCFSQFEHLENSPAGPSAADGGAVCGPRSGRISSEPYKHEESVCETTCSAIVLLGLASSEKLQKACNQIKGCWEGEGSQAGNSNGVMEVL